MSRVFIEPLDRSDNDSFLGIGLWRSSDPLLSLPVAAQLLVFTMIRGCWFSRLPQNWGVRGEERASLKCLIALYSYQDSSIFLAKDYPDCYQPLVNIQNSEKIDIDHFVTIFIASLEERVFRGPRSAVPSDVSKYYLCLETGCLYICQAISVLG